MKYSVPGVSPFMEPVCIPGSETGIVFQNCTSRLRNWMTTDCGNPPLNRSRHWTVTLFFLGIIFIISGVSGQPAKANTSHFYEMMFLFSFCIILQCFILYKCWRNLLASAIVKSVRIETLSISQTVTISSQSHAIVFSDYVNGVLFAT